VEQDVDTLHIWLKTKTPRKSQEVSEEEILEIKVKEPGLRSWYPSNFGWLEPEPEIWVPVPQTYFVEQASYTNNRLQVF